MDLGSTKRLIVEAIARLPEGFDPIGGHPICGRERLSLENADPAMYREAPFVLTPTGRTSPRAMDAARQVIEALGAWSMILEAVEHDRVLAYTSHLPFLVSSALVRSVPKAAASLPGPGFKSASRLSGTPTLMMLGVLETNREFILTALRDMMAQLSEIESSLTAQDFVGLESILNESRDKHQVFKI